MKPSLRKPVGILLLLLFLAAYAGLAVRIAERAGGLPVWVQTLVYLGLGIAWVTPLGPWLRYMETGRWRRPRG